MADMYTCFLCGALYDADQINTSGQSVHWEWHSARDAEIDFLKDEIAGLEVELRSKVSYDER